MRGTLALVRRRTSAAKRMTGTETNINRNALARPTVIGKPRNTRATNDSRGEPGGERAATARPTTIGTASANVNQTARIAYDGIHLGTCTKASASAASRGATTP